MVKLPIEINDFQEYAAQHNLDGAWYGIQVYHNKRYDTWVVDITNTDGVILKSSIPLGRQVIFSVAGIPGPFLTLETEVDSNIPGIGYGLFYYGN